MHLFGDASEPSDVLAARVCVAVLVLPHGSKRCFSVNVPSRVLANLVERKKQICVLELLWVVLAFFSRPALLRDACVLAFADNEGAPFSAIRAMSKRYDINALLSFLWLLANQLSCQMWMGRFALGHNPADCLTKPWVEAPHLEGAQDASASINWPNMF